MKFLFSLVIVGITTGPMAFAGEDKKGTPVPDGLKALKHADPVVRYKAAAILGRLGKTAKFAVPELREALKDKDGYVRIKVAEALWRIERTPMRIILPVLLDALKDKDAGVRATVPAVLALIGSPARSAFPALIGAL